MKLFHVKFLDDNSYLEDVQDDGSGGLECSVDSKQSGAAKLPQGMAEYFADLFDGEVEEV